MKLRSPFLWTVLVPGPCSKLLLIYCFIFFLPPTISYELTHWRMKHFHFFLRTSFTCKEIRIMLHIFLDLNVFSCFLYFYFSSTRMYWSKDSEDLRSKLNLQQPPSPNAQIFPQAWYSNEEGAPMYFLVTETDSFQSQTPSMQRYMTWHRGKPMKVLYCARVFG